MDKNVPLKDLANKHNLIIGTAVSAKNLREDKKYQEIILREFNVITPENAMKFWATHPALNKYNFTNADEIVEFAQKNNLMIRGHTLVWDHNLPDWLTKSGYGKEEITKILKDHIQTVITRYSGKLIAWDVVNEPIHDGKFGLKNFWYETIGPEYLELSFRWAKEADPKAKLFLNEWGAEEINSKSDVIYFLIKNLLQKGVPIEGIGFQMHRGIGDPKIMHEIPDLVSMKNNFQRFADLGLEIQITEMDIQTYGYQGNHEQILKAQAKAYEDIVKTVIKIPNVKALIFWGILDKYSWIPASFNHPDFAHIFDNDYLPKPAYNAVVNALVK